MKHNKLSVHISDTAYEGLIKLAHTTGYVRGIGKDDRPRGLSRFVSMLSLRDFKDTRPDIVRDTGQWYTGTEPCKERCLHVAPQVVASLGRAALRFGIWPYKTQAPVVNGYRREATPPVLYPAGATPLGRTSVKALASPVLEAVGIGWLTPDGLVPAPPDLYATRSKRFEARERRRIVALSDSL